MKDLTYRIAHFLYSNTVWIFGTMILIVSTIYMIDTTPRDFINPTRYFFIVAMSSTLFLPVLIYSGWRKRLSSTRLWLIVFILWPFLLSIFDLEVMLFGPEWDGAFIPTFGILLFFTELGIIYSQTIFEKWTFFYKLKHLKLEKTILILFLPLTIIILFSVVDFSQITETSFLGIILIWTSYIIQIYLIILVYYFFYLVNHYVLINRLFKEKGIVYYLFGAAATLIVFYPIAAFIIFRFPMAKEHLVLFAPFGMFDQVNITIPFFVMIASIPFILSYQWLKQNNEIVSLEKEKSETELNLLKQQINPHFFFNTLNNLYALSLTKDKRTPDVIIQLSELMRYVIYKGKEPEAKLLEEVKYIEDYIQLQKMRLHQQLDFQIEKRILDEQINIPPLLFIILVENAFKHGIEPAEKKSFLHISIESTDRELIFTCTNSVENRQETEPGIGLDNLKSRLKLHFPDRHSFVVNETENSFEATLSILLN